MEEVEVVLSSHSFLLVLLQGWFTMLEESELSFLLAGRGVAPYRAQQLRLCTASGRAADGAKGQTEIQFSLHSPSRVPWSGYNGNHRVRCPLCPRGQTGDP